MALSSRKWKETWPILLNNCSLCFQSYTEMPLKKFSLLFCIKHTLKINVLFCLWKYYSWSVSQFERKLNSIDKDGLSIRLTCHANKWALCALCQCLHQCQDSPRTDSALKALLILNPSTCACCRDILMNHDDTHDLHGSVSSWICHRSKSHKLNFSCITVWPT